MSQKVIVMAIKPKYAKAIYEGRKNWEFRKAPPPLFKTILLYETAPVSAVTGVVVFGEPVTALRVTEKAPLEVKVKLDAKPPQNWGRYILDYHKTEVQG